MSRQDWRELVQFLKQLAVGLGIGLVLTSPVWVPALRLVKG
ncbi:hypothetical protein [Undibacterium sp. Jales W-56]|nr:hypothetical protein [Undibacterium sp. Jales W-56]